ncbi:hypothetical protein [Porphyromonas gulae]|uniref:hypothetical protein n=1 Tax=Porphyromonas gulae TaxID=111105 RepID=UPI00068B85CA|nr:hypothetical protein [Porphyromonas gulae]
MKIKINQRFASGEADTKDMKLMCLKARGQRLSGYEGDADLCIGGDWNIQIASIHTGDVESSNALCAEIVRRFNEFPEELKR